MARKQATTLEVGAKAELSYQQGSSDKVYQVELKAEGEGWVVDVEYGRRGSRLNTQRKIGAWEPVTWEQAHQVFEKTVREKKGKGYVGSVTHDRAAGVTLLEQRQALSWLTKKTDAD